MNFDLENELLNSVKQSISEHETSLIENQKKSYSKWMAVREKLVSEQIEQLKLEKRKEELAEKLRQLQEKQERLLYFEQQEKIARGVQGYNRRKVAEKRKEMEEQFVDIN